MDQFRSQQHIMKTITVLALLKYFLRIQINSKLTTLTIGHENDIKKRRQENVWLHIFGRVLNTSKISTRL